MNGEVEQMMMMKVRKRERQKRQCGEEEKESFCLVKFCVNVEG